MPMTIVEKMSLVTTCIYVPEFMVWFITTLLFFFFFFFLFLFFVCLFVCSLRIFIQPTIMLSNY